MNRQRHSGSSPADYRKAGLDLVVNAKREIAPEDVSHIANNISRSPEIVWLEEIKIAGIRGMTSISDNRLPGLWKQFRSLHTEFFGTERTGYSVCETQQAVYTEDGDVLFSVMLGCPADNLEELPPMLSGTLANLFKTYKYIFGTWLSAAEEELDDREDFEVYEREVTAFDDPDNEVKIYIPIK